MIFARAFDLRMRRATILFRVIVGVQPKRLISEHGIARGRYACCTRRGSPR